MCSYVSKILSLLVVEVSSINKLIHQTTMVKMVTGQNGNGSNGNGASGDNNNTGNGNGGNGS